MAPPSKVEREIARLARRIAALEKQAARHEHVLGRQNEIVAYLQAKADVDQVPRRTRMR